MSATLFRRCGCRDEHGKQYGTLRENATPDQESRACPTMLEDPKHGRWSFRISAGFETKVDPATGKPKRTRRQVNGGSYATKREAQQARNKAAVKVDAGTYVKPTKQTFGEYLPRWLEQRQRTEDGLRPATVENYARYIRQDIAPSPLGAMKLDAIRKHHIHAFLDELTTAGRGAVTVRRIAAVVQGALRTAADDELIEDNPSLRLRLPKVDERRFEPWQPEQVGAFLDVAAEHRLGAFFELAVFTGLRRHELVGLRWSDVDTTRRLLTVRQSKTDAGLRVVDLDDRSTGALLAWQLQQATDRDEWGPAWIDSGHVFTYEDGRPLKLQYVTRLFDKVRVKAKLPEMTLHGLRHMHASLMIASGTNLAVVSKRLGHSSVQITGDIYAHLIGSASRDAANSAAALVPSKRVGAHTVHTHRAQNAEEAAPDFSETASDLRLSQSG